MKEKKEILKFILEPKIGQIVKVYKNKDYLYGYGIVKGIDIIEIICKEIDESQKPKIIKNKNGKKIKKYKMIDIKKDREIVLLIHCDKVKEPDFYLPLEKVKFIN